MAKIRTPLGHNCKKLARGDGFRVLKQKRGRTAEGPQFVVTGLHVIILIAFVLAAAWFTGLLPDP